MSVVIRVDNLSKQYRLGTVNSVTFKEDAQRWLAKMRGKEDPFLKLTLENNRELKGDTNFVWSLKDLSFDVQQGDVLGVIGRNGAGKSTLLKILSKVTAPTIGSVKMKGRIASLLEVGTGFHPELTGRENIFLNGAILGMRKQEIHRKLDEIIAFAGIERYVDTPVKRYSSGMYVRLAFAVAAHLESEILIVDEVLAVGDADFQKKCLGKMGDISKSDGRTILFVSHNMPSISTLCNKAIFLQNGQLIKQGTTSECITSYFGGSENDNYKKYSDIQVTNIFTLHSIRVFNRSKNQEDIIYDNDLILIELDYTFFISNVENFHFTFHLNDENGNGLFSFTNVDTSLKPDNNFLTFEIPSKFLQSGMYYLSFILVENKKKPLLFEQDLFNFRIVDGTRQLGDWMGREPGFVRPIFHCY
jgi:lipopolysaccharide transport system ATP-binding protein